LSWEKLAKYCNGKPIAFCKNFVDEYIYITRCGKKPQYFIVGEYIKFTNEKIETFTFFDEHEFQEKHHEIINEYQNQDAILNKFGIDYLYHMTHKDNLQNILENGLKSHNEAKIGALTKVDIAEKDVNAIRAKKNDTVYNRNLHDYVPLYFNPKNPMLFVKNKEGIEDDIVILAINRRILFNENVIFTNGNAATRTTSFYNNPNDLDQLAWSCINANFWNDIPDGKRLKCSETLAYSNIPTIMIEKIFCNNNQTRDFATLKSVNYPKIDVEINPNLYFSANIGMFNFYKRNRIN
jgi:ssDNA thymidine ADP-ribosyltransferase, DarT